MRHFDLLATRYEDLRTFTPAVIAALPLTGNTTSPSVTALLTAVEVLRGSTAPPAPLSRTRRPPPRRRCSCRRAGVATSTPPAVKAAARPTDLYWELGVLYGVQAGLRSGDLWVPGSRRYTDPSTLLLPPDRWAGQRDDFCTITGTDPSASRHLDRLEAELHAAVAA